MKKRADKERNEKKRGVILFARISVICILFLAMGGYLYYWNHIPEHIRVGIGQKRQLSLNIPASGKVENSENDSKIDIALDVPVTIQAGKQKAEYEVALKLFGVVPLKTMKIEVCEPKKIWLVGETYGFYLETKGVLVVGIGSFVDENGNMQAPSKGTLQLGDKILSVNGEKMENKKQFTEWIQKGETLNCLIEREESQFTEILSPKKDENGEWKLGIWIRDNAQGVGTVTFVTDTGEFGALGHPITDTDTNEILPMEEGRLYDTEIVSIQKGSKETTGSMTGVIDYRKQFLEGVLLENTEYGIYGYSEKLRENAESLENYELGLRQEVHPGKAYVYTNVSGTLQFYEIEILHAKVENHTNRSILFKVTDEQLLSLTGGIVQGMSGVPIIQDGKWVGAVTHVLLNDASMGYGIFAEDMLK